MFWLHPWNFAFTWVEGLSTIQPEHFSYLSCRRWLLTGENTFHQGECNSGAPLNAHPFAHFILFSITVSAVTIFTYSIRGPLIQFGSAMLIVENISPFLCCCSCRRAWWLQKQHNDCEAASEQVHLFYPHCLTRLRLLHNWLRGISSLFSPQT